MKFRISRITCTFVTESIEALQISMQNKLKKKRLVRQAKFSNWRQRQHMHGYVPNANCMGLIEFGDDHTCCAFRMAHISRPFSTSIVLVLLGNFLSLSLSACLCLSLVKIHSKPHTQKASSLMVSLRNNDDRFSFLFLSFSILLFKRLGNCWVVCPDPSSVEHRKSPWKLAVAIGPHNRHCRPWRWHRSFYRFYILRSMLFLRIT